MTYEEALHEISVMAHEETKDDISMRISKDCYHNLVIALEKQMPHKLSPKSSEGWKIFVCGKCEGYMDLLQGNLDYCPNCGQAIDWSDEE